MTDQIEVLNQKISALEHDALNQASQQNNVGYSGMSYGPGRPPKRKVSSKPKPVPEVGYSSTEIYEKIKKQEEEKLPIINNGEKILLDFVHFCMAKKIDIKQHLRSYDTSKNGRLNDDVFMKAIRELKTSFTDNDISELIKISRAKDSDDIVIDEFVKLLQSKDNNYKATFKKL